MKRNLRKLLLTRVYNGRSTTIFCVTSVTRRLLYTTTSLVATPTLAAWKCSDQIVSSAPTASAFDVDPELLLLPTVDRNPSNTPRSVNFFIVSQTCSILFAITKVHDQPLAYTTSTNLAAK